MREPLSIDAKGQGPTGPKTPEGKRDCRLNLEALAPVTDFQRDLAQTSFPLFDRSIADDRWRLKRARTIESGMVAIGMQHCADDTGSPQVDYAMAQAPTLDAPTGPGVCFFNSRSGGTGFSL
jgi:hypothetical protein